MALLQLPQGRIGVIKWPLPACEERGAAFRFRPEQSEH